MSSAAEFLASILEQQLETISTQAEPEASGFEQEINQLRLLAALETEPA